MMNRQGLVIVHTGNGKGKTTAALGLAVRAWGQGLKILIMQFIKGGWKYGELKSLKKFEPEILIQQMGEGFVKKANTADEKENHIKLAQNALVQARKEMLSGKWDMLILDEINYAVKFGLLTVEDVLDLLKDKPQEMHLVLTGREANEKIIDIADLVTEMKEIKHPYQKGIKAQQGVEF